MTDREQDLPGGYPKDLASLREQVRAAQHRAQRIVNTAGIERRYTIEGL